MPLLCGRASLVKGFEGFTDCVIEVLRPYGQVCVNFIG